LGRSLLNSWREGCCQIRCQSAGEFYTPAEVGIVMARIMDIEPGMDVYDPCCGSAGLLIKCELALQEKMSLRSRKNFARAMLYGQENEPGTWVMANRNMIIHDTEGEIQIGDTFRKPKFRKGNRLQTFDPGAASRGSGNANTNKEKDVRRWFVEQDLIEGVLYLP
jgi:type I restriction-modification system DNA methylase subunit